MSDPPVAIIGSGTMGLTLGRLLPESILYEKAPFIGGSSRTIQHKGFHFDTGLHFLPRLDPEVEDFLKPLLGDGLRSLELSEKGWAVIQGGKVLRNPSGIEDLVRPLNPFLKVPLLTSHYFRRAFPRRGPSEEALTINHYGDLYYRFFLKAPIEKFGGLPPSKKIFPWTQSPKTDPLPLRIARWIRRGGKSPERKPAALSYPFPWFGSLIEKLAEGLEVRTSSEITWIDFSPEKEAVRIRINRQEPIACRNVVFTVPPHLVLPLFNPPPDILERASAIRYQDLIYGVLFFNAGEVMDSYIVYGSGREIFSRAFEPKKLCGETAPADKTAVCFEIPCFKDSPLWKTPDGEILERASGDLRRHYRGTPQPYDGIVFRFPRVLFLFDASLEENLKAVYQFASQFKNVYFPGREAVLQGGRNTNTAIKEAFRIFGEIRERAPALAIR